MKFFSLNMGKLGLFSYHIKNEGWESATRLLLRARVTTVFTILNTRMDRLQNLSDFTSIHFKGPPYFAQTKFLYDLLSWLDVRASRQIKKCELICTEASLNM